MSVEYRKGDLFAQTDVGAIGHGVNISGSMSGGIAVPFKNKFPDMHQEYVELCSSGDLKLGDVFVYHDDSTGKTVFNIASQQMPGADASLEAVETGLRKSLELALSLGIDSLAIPRIGCGIGGLNWADDSGRASEGTVKEIVERVAAASLDRKSVV